MDQKTFDIIQRISEEHSHKKFGYLEENDLRNEIWVICLDKLDSFNPEKGDLEHFLRVTVKNRLVNRFKDITKSVRSPCPRCPYFDASQTPDCTRYGENREQCKKWNNYQLSVKSRNSLLNSSEGGLERHKSENVVNSMISQEVYLSVVDKISPKLRYDFEELVSGGKLSSQKTKKLKTEIIKILEETVTLTIGGKEVTIEN